MYQITETGQRTDAHRTDPSTNEIRPKNTTESDREIVQRGDLVPCRGKKFSIMPSGRIENSVRWPINKYFSAQLIISDWFFALSPNFIPWNKCNLQTVATDVFCSTAGIFLATVVIFIFRSVALVHFSVWCIDGMIHRIDFRSALEQYVYFVRKRWNLHLIVCTD